MKKYRDGVHRPLIVAIPALLLLMLLVGVPNQASGRESPPVFRQETDGGGDEWPNELTPPDHNVYVRSDLGDELVRPERSSPSDGRVGSSDHLGVIQSRTIDTRGSSSLAMLWLQLLYLVGLR
jgi:hypothetical protein